jgi:hypothetical protein
MLIDRASAVIGDIKDLNKLGTSVDQLTKTQTRLDGLLVPLGTLNSLLGKIKLFSDQGIALASDNGGDLAALKSQLAQLLIKFGEDRYSVLEPDSEMKFKFWDRLKEFPSKAEKGLSKQWRDWVEGLCPKLNEEILAVLGKTSLKPRVDEILSIWAKMGMMSNKLPETTFDFDNARKLGASLTTLWNNLEGGGIPPEVLDLLKKATSDEGAPLDSLTQSTQDWLESRKILNTLRLKIQ